MRGRWIAAAVAAMALFPMQALADADAAWKSYCGRAYARALAELRPLAEAGDAKAQYYLASIYLDGSAVPRSAATAVELLQRAAKRFQPPPPLAPGACQE